MIFIQCDRIPDEVSIRSCSNVSRVISHYQMPEPQNVTNSEGR
jgi:hypothetical protein